MKQTMLKELTPSSSRSYNMSRIRSRDTKPECLVRSMIHGWGYRFRLHCRELPGKPDIVLVKHRKIIFVHGCFWHAHGCRVGGNQRSRRRTLVQPLHKEVSLESLITLGLLIFLAYWFFKHGKRLGSVRGFGVVCFIEFKITTANPAAPTTGGSHDVATEDTPATTPSRRPKRSGRGAATRQQRPRVRSEASMSEKTPLVSEPTANKSTKPAQLDDLVEIQHASLAKVFHVSQPESSSPAAPSASRSSKSQDDHRAKPTIEFLGQGKSLPLHQGVICDPKSSTVESVRAGVGAKFVAAYRSPQELFRRRSRSCLSSRWKPFWLLRSSVKSAGYQKSWMSQKARAGGGQRHCHDRD